MSYIYIIYKGNKLVIPNSEVELEKRNVRETLKVVHEGHPDTRDTSGNMNGPKHWHRRWKDCRNVFTTPSINCGEASWSPGFHSSTQKSGQTELSTTAAHTQRDTLVLIDELSRGLWGQRNQCRSERRRIWRDFHETWILVTDIVSWGVVVPPTKFAPPRRICPPPWLSTPASPLTTVIFF